MTTTIEKHGHFRLNRLFSRPLSSLLLKTPITPNQITLLSLMLGITAGWAFSRGDYASSLMGAFFYQTAIVLDNCDGEVARAKNMKSRLGAWLDIVADFFTDVSLFLGIGAGILTTQPDKPVLIFMTLCLSGACLHMSLVVWEKLRGFGPAVFESVDASRKRKINPVMNLFDALREGETSWLVLFFAILGKMDWILWCGGFYMQFIWMSALLLNARRLFSKKSFS